MTTFVHGGATSAPQTPQSPPPFGWQPTPQPPKGHRGAIWVCIVIVVAIIAAVVAIVVLKSSGSEASTTTSSAAPAAPVNSVPAVVPAQPTPAASSDNSSIMEVPNLSQAQMKAWAPQTSSTTDVVAGFQAWNRMFSDVINNGNVADINDQTGAGAAKYLPYVFSPEFLASTRQDAQDYVAQVEQQSSVYTWNNYGQNVMMDGTPGNINKALAQYVATGITYSSAGTDASGAKLYAVTANITVSYYQGKIGGTRVTDAAVSGHMTSIMKFVTIGGGTVLVKTVPNQ